MPRKTHTEKMAELAHERAVIARKGDEADTADTARVAIAAPTGAAALWAQWSPTGANRFSPVNDDFLHRVVTGRDPKVQAPPLRRLPSGPEAQRLREYVGVPVEQLAHRCFCLPEHITTFEATSVLPVHHGRNVHNEAEPIREQVIDQTAYGRFLSAAAVIYTARDGAPWPARPAEPTTADRPEPSVMYAETYTDELAHFTSIGKVSRGEVLCPVLSNVPPPATLLRLYEVAYQRFLPPVGRNVATTREMSEKGLARIVGGPGGEATDWYWRIHGWADLAGPVEAPMSVLRVLGVLTCWAEAHGAEMEAERLARAEAEAQRAKAQAEAIAAVKAEAARVAAAEAEQAATEAARLAGEQAPAE